MKAKKTEKSKEKENGGNLQVEKERRRGESAGVADLSGRLSLTGSINLDLEKADEERRKEKERRDCKMPINR